jgi:hypothetical protein
VDDKEVGAFIEAIDGAHLDAIGVLTLDAVITYHKGHCVFLGFKMGPEKLAIAIVGTLSP